jgi:hypothetical protein
MVEETTHLIAARKQRQRKKEEAGIPISPSRAHPQ